MVTSFRLSSPTFAYSKLLLLGVVGAAAGLNLAVMNLGSQPADAEVATPTVASSDAPQIQQVVVDVPVPSGQFAVEESLTDDSSQPATAPASQPLPAIAPIAPPATPPPAAAPTAPPTTAAAPTAPPTTAAAPTTPSTAGAAPTTATTPAPTSPAPTTTPQPTTEYLTYRFDGVAEIVVAYHDGRSLEFWSATPEDGWAFAVEKNSANAVEVKFRRVGDGEGEATFEVKREDGELRVKKER